VIERPPVLSEDARATLTSAASSAARSNKPRWLIYLGAVAVVATLIYTGYNLTRRVAAQADLSNRRAQFAEVKVEVDKIAAIKAADDALGGDTTPDPRMESKINKIGTGLGLVFASVTEGDDQRPNPSKAVKRKRYDFKLTNQPADSVFTWLKRVNAELGGVQLNRIDISPGDGTNGTPGWNVSVTFTRWERVS
jgi:hypothetical protein